MEKYRSEQMAAHGFVAFALDGEPPPPARARGRRRAMCSPARGRLGPRPARLVRTCACSARGHGFAWATVGWVLLPHARAPSPHRRHGSVRQGSAAEQRAGGVIHAAATCCCATSALGSLRVPQLASCSWAAAREIPVRICACLTVRVQAKGNMTLVLANLPRFFGMLDEGAAAYDRPPLPAHASSSEESGFETLLRRRHRVPHGTLVSCHT